MQTPFGGLTVLTQSRILQVTDINQSLVLMLRHVGSRPKSLLLFDFLAPNVCGYRLASSGTPRSAPKKSFQARRPDPEKLAAFPLQGKDPPALCQNIKQRISFLSNPDTPIPSDPDITLFNETVVELRQALKARDIHGAWTHWTRLEEKKLIQFLGPQLQGYSKLVADLCADPTAEARDDRERKFIEEIALAAAAGGAAEALKACMMFHLKRGDPNAVLELHGNYTLSLGAREVWEEPLAVENNTGKDNGLALGLHTEKIPYNPAKVSILLAVITAHAMSDSFEGALQAFMQSTVRIQQATVKDFLLSIPDAALRRKVEAYIRRLDTARLVSQPSFLSKQISLLAQNQNVARLEKLYSTVIDGLSGSLPYLTLRTDQATSHTLIILEVSWAAFLTAFMQCRRRDLAEKLWDDVMRHGAQPGVIMWTALLDGYDSMGEVDDALKAWQTMISQGVKPDALTYRALISTLYNARRSDEAIKYFESYAKESSKGLVATSSDSLSVYNTVLHGLLTNGQDEKAVILLQRMEDGNTKPDIVSYNTFLRYYGRRGDFKGVSSILKQLTDNGLGGDVFTYSTILSALLKAGRTDATDIVLNIMKRQNVEPNAAVYSAIIDYQVREQTEEGLRGAIELLQKMEENPEAQPNEVTYTSILAGVHRGVWSNENLAAECRQYILGRMKARNIQPNRVTYHILLQACFDNPESHGLQSALGYYREMVKRRILMTHDTWYIILHGLVVREEWAVADEIVDDFNKSGLKSIGRLTDLVCRVRRRTVKKMRLGPKAYI